MIRISRSSGRTRPYAVAPGSATRLLSVIVLTASALSACGDARPVDPRAAAVTREELGSCSPERSGHVDAEPIAARLTRPLRWVQAEDFVKESDPQPGASKRAATVRLLRTTPFLTQTARPADEAGSLFAPYVDYARKAVQSGRRLIAGLDPHGEVLVLAGVDRDGGVTFVGDCEHRFLTTPFDRYIATEASGRKPVDVLRAIVASPVGGAAQDFTAFFSPAAPATWDELPPARRQIDPETTPQSVLASLASIDLRYDVPAAWREETGVLLCTRLPLAWGECTALSGGSSATDPIPFHSSAVAGKDLEVWGLNETGDLEAPLGRAGVISADVIARALARDKPVLIRPMAGIETYEDFRAAMAAGRDSLEVVDVT